MSVTKRPPKSSSASLGGVWAVIVSVVVCVGGFLTWWVATGRVLFGWPPKPPVVIADPVVPLPPVVGVATSPPPPVAKHESQVLSVWETYTRAEGLRAARRYADARSAYEDVIFLANDCINEFTSVAGKLQDPLRMVAPIDLNGPVSQADQIEFEKRGPLNVVAACMWLRGRSAARAGRRPRPA